MVLGLRSANSFKGKDKDYMSNRVGSARQPLSRSCTGNETSVVIIRTMGDHPWLGLASDSQKTQTSCWQPKRITWANLVCTCHRTYLQPCARRLGHVIPSDQFRRLLLKPNGIHAHVPCLIYNKRDDSYWGDSWCTSVATVNSQHRWVWAPGVCVLPLPPPVKLLDLFTSNILRNAGRKYKIHRTHSSEVWPLKNPRRREREQPYSYRTLRFMTPGPCTFSWGMPKRATRLIGRNSRDGEDWVLSHILPSWVSGSFGLKQPPCQWPLSTSKCRGQLPKRDRQSASYLVNDTMTGTDTSQGRPQQDFQCLTISRVTFFELSRG